MKKYFIVIFLMLGQMFVPAKPAVSAPPSMAVPLSLAISQIKITGDEFVIIKNNTGKDIPDLSVYWLDGYNSNQPLAAGVSNSSQQLPPFKLGSSQTILLSSNGMATCGAAATGKLSVSLTDSGGFLQIVQTAQTALGVTKFPVDLVSWSSGADERIPNVPSSTKNPKAVYYRYASPSGFSWQLADTDSSNPCQLNVSGGSVSDGLVQAAVTVPSVVSIAGSTGGINLPAADIGLAAPQISEVLPNPATPQTDADDEFIELYNSNDKQFDLSGFILQTGTTSLRKYTFPDGTIIGARQFLAFYSADTGIGLSNSQGRVSLLDPSGNVLGQTDEYTTAKDGYAWVSADGLWQWTTTPTPAALNIITTPPLSKKLAAQTAPAAKKSTKSAKTAAASPASSSLPPDSKPAAGLHPAILAGIGSAAVIYALYEYRNDLANQLYKLRRYRASRRIAG